MSNTTNHHFGENHPQYRHGMTDTPEFAAYIDMIRRCYKQEHRAYKNYGGRGIRVCDRWRVSFENFIDDMGLRPGSEYSLDRKENDGDYEPNNCRWATRKEQCNNRRSNRIVCYHGETMTLAQAVTISKGKVTRNIANLRLKKGWSVDTALDVPRIRTARGGKTYKSLGLES